MFVFITHSRLRPSILRYNKYKIVSVSLKSLVMRKSKYRIVSTQISKLNVLEVQNWTGLFIFLNAERNFRSDRH